MTTNLVLALTIGGLFACGVYLMLSRNLIRVILGFLLAGHGVNLMLLSVGGGFVPPIVGEPANGQEVADPIPQALPLRAGQAVHVLGTRGGWSHVECPGGKTGWLKIDVLIR